MIQDKRFYDGFDSLEGGIDAGRRANVLEVNQVASAENISFRGGIAATRSGYMLLDPNFTNQDNSYNDNGDYAGSGVVVVGNEADTTFQNGTFQGALYYAPHDNEAEYILAMIGGRLFQVTPRRTTCDIFEITLPKRNRSNTTKAYLLQADKWAVIQDG